MKTVLMALIRFYRMFISPLKPPCCRFTPTCSEYALQAIEKYGALKWLLFLYSNDFPRQDFLHFFGSIFHFHNMKQAENRHP